MSGSYAYSGGGSRAALRPSPASIARAALACMPRGGEPRAADALRDRVDA